MDAMNVPAATHPQAARRTIPSRDFWRFWAGETISNLGGSFTQFALPLLVFRLTGSALSLGLATAFTVLPYLCFGLVIGALVDRWDRKRLMIVVDLLQAAVVASIPALFLLGHLTIWWLYGVIFLAASLKIFFETGQYAAIPSLVDQDALQAANGRLQASQGVAQVVGPFLAGVLLFLLPLPLLLLVDALSFLVSAAALLSIRRRFNAASPQRGASVWQDTREGLRYVLSHPVLRGMAVFLALLNLLAITTLSQLVVFASVRYHASPWQVSAFYSAGSGGLVLGALSAGRLKARLGFRWLTLGTVAAAGLLTVALALTPSFPLALTLWAAKTSMETLFNVSYVSLRQRLVPDRLLGRVMSSTRMLAWAAIPLGSLLGGLLVTLGGVARIGDVYLGIGLLMLVLPAAFRGLAHVQPARAQAGSHEEQEYEPA